MAKVICENRPALYFKLGTPFVPTTMADPVLPIFPTLDACAEHADGMEGVLKRGGYEPTRVPI